MNGSETLFVTGIHLRGRNFSYCGTTDSSGILWIIRQQVRHHDITRAVQAERCSENTGEKMLYKWRKVVYTEDREEYGGKDK